MRITGEVAVVTGAGSGIGKAVAEALTKEGARVLLVDLSSKVDEIARALGQQAFLGDVTNEASMKEAFMAVRILFGQPATIGVFSAGIFMDGFSVAVDPGRKDPIVIKPKGEFMKVLEVDLYGPWLCSAAMAGELLLTKFAGEGKIILLGSISSEGNGAQANYSAAKAGLVGMMKTLRIEFAKAKLNLDLGIIHPGFTRTPMIAAMRPDALQKVLQRVMSGKVHEPESAAEAVLKMLRDNSVAERFLDRFKHAIGHTIAYPGKVA
jgi:3-oxoacyl-[acyl-carrier protein] reductase